MASKRRRTNKRNRSTVAITQGGKAAFEGMTIAEALQRAGGNPHLKGHIHEILVKNLYNCNPVNLVNDRTAQIVTNPNAKTVDMVVMQGGRVLERLQLKDTPNSIWKTAQQIKSGQYSSAQILGTPETVDKLSRVGGLGNKTIRSSGVSSKTTEALAQRAGATGSGTVQGAMLQSARSSGIAGGVVSGGIAAIQGGVDLLNGDKEVPEVVGNITKESIGGAGAGAVAGAAATGVGAAIGGTALAGTAAAVAAPVVAAVVVGAAAKYVYDEVAGDLIEDIATGTAELAGEIMGVGFEAAEEVAEFGFDVAEEILDIGFDVLGTGFDVVGEVFDVGCDILDDIFGWF